MNRFGTALALVLVLTASVIGFNFYWLSATKNIQNNLLEYQANFNGLEVSETIPNKQVIEEPKDSEPITIKTSSIKYSRSSSSRSYAPPKPEEIPETPTYPIGYYGAPSEGGEPGPSEGGGEEEPEEGGGGGEPLGPEGDWFLMSPATSPSSRKIFAMDIIDSTDKIILFGGWDSSSNCDTSPYAFCNGTWVYDYSDDDWTMMTPISSPSARRNPAATKIDGTDKVVLFGGYSTLPPDCDGSGGFNCDGTWVYDYSDDDWTMMNPATHPGAREYHAMATLHGTDKVVLFGGLIGGGNYLNDVWVYDLSDNDWILMSPINSPSKRYDPKIAVVDGTDKVVMFGGHDVGGADDETWVYDYSDDAWTQINPTSKPTQRHAHSMAMVYSDDKVILFAGYDGGIDDETWVYDLSDSNWTQMSPSPKPNGRGWHEIATLDGTDDVVLFGGAGLGGSEYDDTWIYSLT